MRDLESTLRGTFADRYKRELSSSKSLGSTRSLSGSFSRRDASTHVPEKRMADLSLLAPQLAMTGSSRPLPGCVRGSVPQRLQVLALTPWVVELNKEKSGVWLRQNPPFSLLLCRTVAI